MNTHFVIRRVPRHAGFTLIEIMLVVGIITVLMGAAIFHLAGNLELAKEQRVRGDIQAISTQLKTYETFNLVLPTTEPIPPRWKQMMTQIQLDPWGMAYVYRYPGKKNPKSFDLFSLGPDRIESDDDIGNWQ
jgi:general secretion pathway protein G